MQNSEQQERVEQALRKHLGRTQAPDALWIRLQQARTMRPQVKRTFLAWATVTGALCMAAGGWMAFRLYQPAVSVEAMAVESLSKGPEHLALQTTDPNTIRDWVRANSSLEVPLPGLTSKDIQIMGANVLPGSQLQNNGQVVEVSYRVGEYQAALFISKDPTNARTYPKHQSQDITSVSGARVSSWSMRGQNYTLAWGSPGEFKTACLLCHTGSDRALN